MPKYNPRNSKSCQEDWIAVVAQTSEVAHVLGLPDAGLWCSNLPTEEQADQERPGLPSRGYLRSGGIHLAGLCPNISAVIGDTVNGYMVTPVSAATHKILKKGAGRIGVPIA